MSYLTVSNEDIHVLRQLGLSSLEARVYIALTRTERATIKALSKSTDLARQHVYQVINDLLDIGIIEKIVAAPFEYSAIPIKDAIFIMLQRKQHEFLDMEIEIESAAKQLLERYEAASKIKRTMSQEKQTFVFRNIRLHEVARVRVRDFSDCRSSIDLVILERNLESINEELGDALKKEVKIRMIIGNTERSSFQFSLEDLITNPFFEAKVSLNQAIFPLAILDEKQAVIITSKPSDFPKASYLKTNNSHLMAIAKVYFEKQWTDSQTLKAAGN
ncbi:MAG: TrmB family transcriptional regulator [Candidatus Bathyarchaeia archaeon]|jgi:sugar-specific transcriptional regulator TrmB